MLKFGRRHALKRTGTHEADENQAKYHALLCDAEGSKFHRYQANRKCTEVTLKFDEKTFEISVIQPKTRTIIIDLFHVREIRTGTQALLTKDFKQCAEASKIKSKNPIAIMFGYEFKLTSLCITPESKDVFVAWSDGLLRLLKTHDDANEQKHYTYRMIMERWLTKQWRDANRFEQASISLREIKQWVPNLHVKLNIKDIKDCAAVASKTQEGVFGSTEFRTLCNLLMAQPSIQEYVNKFTTVKGFVSKADLAKFFEKQGEPFSDAMISDFMAKHATDSSFTIEKFIDFLYSEDNSIRAPHCDEVYHNMDRPLAHYFINSSHNTYLTGDQFRSESSVEAYARSLQAGCRCVEIDTWDVNNEPTVYHGRTLTSKIRFRDVVEVINEHAFVASQYPIILSIENHCSLPVQKIMAENFVSAFGKKIVKEPLPDCKNATEYPSPNQLKDRVIIKHKKLKDKTGEVEAGVSASAGLSSSLYSGTILLEDPNGEWQKHFFVLYPHQLISSKADENTPETPEEAAAEEPSQLNLGKDDLHWKELWFHGLVKGGRQVAEDLIKASGKSDGCFLVRDAERFPGEYSLSFLHDGTINHARIRVRDKSYFLTDEIAFPSLYELIDHYRSEPIKGDGFEIRLTEPVPAPIVYPEENWYHHDLTRAQSEDMLRRVPYDGAFLIRRSGDDFAISFRYEGKVKHCKIRKEGRIYTVGTFEFESLVKLVEYFKIHSLYKKMKLKYPVDETFVKEKGGEPTGETYLSGVLYHDPNANTYTGGVDKATITCKANYDYKATNPDELSFPKDAIIADVSKEDDDWWQGSYNDQRGYFPSNYVDEINADALAHEEAEEKGVLGTLEQDSFSLASLNISPQKGTAKQRTILRLQDTSIGKSIDCGFETDADFTAWLKALTEAIQASKQSTLQQNKLQQKMKIRKELSELVFYVQSVSFHSFEEASAKPYYTMSSFAEKKAFGFAMDRASNGSAAAFNNYNIRQISRIYPLGTRVDSSNYDPQPMWNVGCQLVALNFQTPDYNMHLNSGKFLDNGNSGYLLKPEVMLKPGFNPFDRHTYADQVQSMRVKIKVLGGRHLRNPDGTSLTPFVEISVSGANIDSNQHIKTKTVSSNGFNPCWDDEASDFTIMFPDLACLVFQVMNEDMFGDAVCVAQCALPIGTVAKPSIRSGIRSIPLRSIWGDPLELSSLLVDITVSPATDKDLEALMQDINAMTAERDEIVKSMVLKSRKGQLDAAQQQRFQEITTELNTLHKRRTNLQAKSATLKPGGSFHMTAADSSTLQDFARSQTT